MLSCFHPLVAALAVHGGVTAESVTNSAPATRMLNESVQMSLAMTTVGGAATSSFEPLSWTPRNPSTETTTYPFTETTTSTTTVELCYFGAFVSSSCPNDIKVYAASQGLVFPTQEVECYGGSECSVWGLDLLPESSTHCWSIGYGCHYPEHCSEGGILEDIEESGAEGWVECCVEDNCNDPDIYYDKWWFEVSEASTIRPALFTVAAVLVTTVAALC